MRILTHRITNTATGDTLTGSMAPDTSDPDTFAFYPGESNYRSVFILAEWEIEKITPPLPVMVGSVIRTKVDGVLRVLILGAAGDWWYLDKTGRWQIASPERIAVGLWQPVSLFIEGATSRTVFHSLLGLGG